MITNRRSEKVSLFTPDGRRVPGRGSSEKKRKLEDLTTTRVSGFLAVTNAARKFYAPKKSPLTGTKDLVLRGETESLRVAVAKALTKNQSLQRSIIRGTTQDIQAASDRVRALIKTASDAGQLKEYDLVVIGAGPHGSEAMTAAIQKNPNARILVLDAAKIPGGQTFTGAGLFFYINSSNRPDDGKFPRRGAGNFNPIGTTTNPTQLSGRKFPPAEVLSDTTKEQLLYGLEKGAEIALETKLLQVAKNDDGRYDLTLSLEPGKPNVSTPTIKAETLVVASGIGKPKIPAGSDKVYVLSELARVEAEISRLQGDAAVDPNFVPRIITVEQAFRLGLEYKSKGVPARDFLRNVSGELSVAGFGDSSFTFLEWVYGFGPEKGYDGDPAAEGDIIAPRFFVGNGGPKDCREFLNRIRNRYADFVNIFDSSKENPGTLVTRRLDGNDIEQLKGLSRVSGSKPSCIVLGIGYELQTNELLKGLFGGEVIAALESSQKIETMFAPTTFVATPQAVGRRVVGENVYLVGPAAGDGLVNTNQIPTTGRLIDMNGSDSALDANTIAQYYQDKKTKDTTFGVKENVLSLFNTIARTRALLSGIALSQSGLEPAATRMTLDLKPATSGDSQNRVKFEPIENPRIEGDFALVPTDLEQSTLSVLDNFDLPRNIIRLKLAFEKSDTNSITARLDAATLDAAKNYVPIDAKSWEPLLNTFTKTAAWLNLASAILSNPKTKFKVKVKLDPNDPAGSKKVSFHWETASPSLVDSVKKLDVSPLPSSTSVSPTSVSPPPESRPSVSLSTNLTTSRGAKPRLESLPQRRDSKLIESVFPGFLSQKRFSNVNFKEANLSDFPRDFFNSAVFENCDFSGLNLDRSNSRITNSLFTNCSFSKTTFGPLSESRFDFCNLTSATFLKTVLNATWTNCKLNESKFYLNGGSSLERSKFTNCDLDNSRFEMRVSDVSWFNCLLPNSVFNGITLTNATFENCTAIRSYFYDTDLISPTITDSDFNNSQFANSTSIQSPKILRSTFLGSLGTVRVELPTGISGAFNVKRGEASKLLELSR